MSGGAREVAAMTRLGRDLYWTLMTTRGEVRWVGYDDAYWWSNVPDQDCWREQEHAGTRYILDARTCEVELEEGPS